MGWSESVRNRRLNELCSLLEKASSFEEQGDCCFSESPTDARGKYIKSYSALNHALNLAADYGFSDYVPDILNRLKALERRL